MPKTFALSEDELARADTLARLKAGELTLREAADLLGRCPRQVRRLLARFKEFGVKGLISGKRGKPAHNALSPDFKDRVLVTYRTHLWDYRPTLAARVLRDEFGLKISVEALRKLLIAEGSWSVGNKPSDRLHPRRPREECFGALIQIDGTEYEWLEGQEPFCLLVFIDDATSRLVHLLFVPEENSRAYLTAWKEYLRDFGRPIRVYADGHSSLFRQSGSRREKNQDEFTSDLARALKTLNIGRERSMCAQGRGRVERVHSTLKDHLPKYLRLHGATTMEAANKLLPAFLARHNQEYSLKPRCDLNRHRDIPSRYNLELIFSEQSERKLSRSLTLSFASQTLALRRNKAAVQAAGHKVVVHRLTDGSVAVTFRGRVLPHWIVDEFNPPVRYAAGDTIVNEGSTSIH